MNYETKIVVDVCDINLEEDVYDVLADKYEVCNGSYHKWYPNRPGYMFKKDIHDIVQNELNRLGFPIKDDEYYSILLYFSW